MAKRSIVLIHGAFVTQRCWDSFRGRYEEKGFEVVAPSWPHLDGVVAELRAKPPEGLGTLGLKEIVDSYAEVVKGMDSPILIGHSFGGLITQLLLARGLGACGVAIDSAPPRGVLPGWDTIVSNFPVLSGFGAHKKAVFQSQDHFGERFANALPEAEKAGAWEAHMVPSSGRLFFQAALGHADTKIDFKADRAPLLLIAGGADKTVTAGMNRQNHAKYKASPARTDFHLFEGRSHWLIAEPGWEDVADYALDWAVEASG